MAKEKKEVNLFIRPDSGGVTYDKVIVTYVVSDSSDADMQKSNQIELSLSGQDLANAQSLYSLALAAVDGQEGIS